MRYYHHAGFWMSVNMVLGALDPSWIWGALHWLAALFIFAILKTDEKIYRSERGPE